MTKASARKSSTGYKPILIHTHFNRVRTEVLLQSPERNDKYTRRGIIPGNRYAVGAVYPTREEAVAVAEIILKNRINDIKKSIEESKTDRQREFNQKALDFLLNGK